MKEATTVALKPLAPAPPPPPPQVRPEKETETETETERAPAIEPEATESSQAAKMSDQINAPIQPYCNASGRLHNNSNNYAARSASNRGHNNNHHSHHYHNQNNNHQHNHHNSHHHNHHHYQANGRHQDVAQHEQPPVTTSSDPSTPTTTPQTSAISPKTEPVTIQSTSNDESMSNSDNLTGTNQANINGAPRIDIGPPHYVDLHVNAGECVSLQLLDGQEQIVAGPASITMISQQQTPPVPIPVIVPPGHMIHQIADENGTLKHIILSVMDSSNTNNSTQATNNRDNQDNNIQPSNSTTSLNHNHSSVITLPQGTFRIDSNGELICVSSNNSNQPATLPQQAYFANYDGCPVAHYDATGSHILHGAGASEPGLPVNGAPDGPSTGSAQSEVGVVVPTTIPPNQQQQATQNLTDVSALPITGVYPVVSSSGSLPTLDHQTDRTLAYASHYPASQQGQPMAYNNIVSGVQAQAPGAISAQQALNLAAIPQQLPTQQVSHHNHHHHQHHHHHNPNPHHHHSHHSHHNSHHHNSSHHHSHHNNYHNNHHPQHHHQHHNKQQHHYQAIDINAFESNKSQILLTPVAENPVTGSNKVGGYSTSFYNSNNNNNHISYNSVASSASVLPVTYNKTQDNSDNCQVNYTQQQQRTRDYSHQNSSSASNYDGSTHGINARNSSYQQHNDNSNNKRSVSSNNDNNGGVRFNNQKQAKVINNNNNNSNSNSGSNNSSIKNSRRQQQNGLISNRNHQSNNHVQSNNSNSIIGKGDKTQTLDSISAPAMVPLKQHDLNASPKHRPSTNSNTDDVTCDAKSAQPPPPQATAAAPKFVPASPAKSVGGGAWQTGSKLSICKSNIEAKSTNKTVLEAVPSKLKNSLRDEVEIRTVSPSENRKPSTGSSNGEFRNSRVKQKKGQQDNTTSNMKLQQQSMKSQSFSDAKSFYLHSDNSQKQQQESSDQTDKRQQIKDNATGSGRSKSSDTKEVSLNQLAAQNKRRDSNKSFKESGRISPQKEEERLVGEPSEERNAALERVISGADEEENELENVAASNQVVDLEEDESDISALRSSSSGSSSGKQSIESTKPLNLDDSREQHHQQQVAKAHSKQKLKSSQNDNPNTNFSSNQSNINSKKLTTNKQVRAAAQSVVAAKMSTKSKHRIQADNNCPIDSTCPTSASGSSHNSHQEPTSSAREFTSNNLSGNQGRVIVSSSHHHPLKTLSGSHHNHTHHNQHHHHNSHNHIKFNNLIKSCRTKFVAMFGRLIQNSLSSYSDTKFAGLLLIMFTLFAMLLALFIHIYIVAPIAVE